MAELEERKRIRIAVDVMGGDYAPDEIVKGAIYAAQKDDVEITLVGPDQILKAQLANYDISGLPIHCVEANEIVKEGESPALAIRRKPNCSVAVAAKLVKSGEADAMFSAGPTGASAVSAIQFIGMIEGMERPAIGGGLGNFAPDVVLIDVGANVDCKPYQLLAFAVAGSVFAKKLLNITNPKIALLSNGAEEGKGNESVREAYTLLKKSGLNFIGNIEGNDVLTGRANVVVCDGFVGNVLLKFYENMGDYASGWVKQRLRKYPPLRSLVALLFNKLFPITKLSYEGEDEGGGILWGIDGIVRIAHGASQAQHIAHGIASAKNAVEADIVACLKSDLARLKQEDKL